MFLLGRQAMLGQEPPMYFRSITKTCFPCLASVHARYLPPSPLPRTTRSYSLAFEIFSFMKAPLAVFGGYSFADPGYMLQKYHWMNERQHGSRKRLYALSSVRRSISSSAA